jgi:hypothetical protein
MCPTAPDPTSLLGRASERRVCYDTGSCLPAGEGSRAPRVLRLRILHPYREGSGNATVCPVVSRGPQASSMKKHIAGLLVQLGTHVPNVSMPIP